jgi:hypothetical protein
MTTPPGLGTPEPPEPPYEEVIPPVPPEGSEPPTDTSLAEDMGMGLGIRKVSDASDNA